MTINIPKVTTPMDFGVEYLESPSHGNFKFFLEGGEELSANSAIMSFNSPVIKKMIIEDGRTTVDVLDFSKDAILCFLVTCYSGNLKNISKAIFRDVNKIANVFEVTWLADRCFEYFKSLTDAVKEDNFADQVFIFEEAMSIWEKLKTKDYINYVISKFTSLTYCTEYFVLNYLSDITSCSSTNLEVITEITKGQEHIIAKALVNNMKTERPSLDRNSRRILEILNFTTYPLIHSSLYQELLERLEHIENPSVEDFRLIVRIFRESNKAYKETRSSADLPNIPNLFHGFQHLQDINDLDALTSFLIDHPFVCNSYIFYDLIFQWLTDKYHVDNSPFVSITESFARLFGEQLTKKNWEPLARDYILDKTSARLGGLTQRILQNSSLTTSDNYYRVASTSEYTPEELFARNHDLKFKFGKGCDCGKAGDSGLIMHVTAASGRQDDSFNIQLVTDPSLYPDDIHFHQDSQSAATVHLALDITDDEDTVWKNCPVTWYGRPCRDETDKYWSWGMHYFYAPDKGQKPTGCAYLGGWVWGVTAKIRPIMFYIRK